MEIEARKRSVENLQRLFTVVASLAITESLRQLLTVTGDVGTLPEIPTTLTVISLLTTIIPFYHGANRYLDATYVTGERTAKPETLIFDFSAIFLEGIIFFILAVLIRNLVAFYTLLALLFFFDAVWVWITKLTTQSSTIQGEVYISWSITNIIAGLVILFFIWSNLFQINLWSSAMVQVIAVTLVTLTRTIVDYARGWSFYYPPPSGANKKAKKR